MNLIQISEMVADWVAVAAEKGTDVITDSTCQTSRQRLSAIYYKDSILYESRFNEYSIW